VTKAQFDPFSGHQDKVYATLYNLDPNGEADSSSPPATASGNPTDVAAVIQSQVDSQERKLQQTQEALAGILSHDQLNAYKQQELDRINQMAQAMRMLLPKQTE
jgi:hypothetical protein